MNKIMNNSPDDVIAKLKDVVVKSMTTENYKRALAGIGAAGGILYQWNQSYTDAELENYIQNISLKKIKAGFTKEQVNKNTVLYYDAFGLDTRGLAIIYLKALTYLGYKVIYLTGRNSVNNQPVLENAWKSENVVRRFVNKKNSISILNSIQKVFEEFRPANAFFYSIPSDAEGAAVFEAYNQIVIRYQINLTDHAFWLGVRAFDYCIEFRNYGATISAGQRGIEKNKIIRLPYYPYVDSTIPYQGMPDITKDNKMIFSGGALYKTLGDKEHKYYKAVEKILEHNPKSVFVYAGSGDDSQLKKLLNKYPNRSAHIQERTDLYEVMKHSSIYINTYPMVGGLMMQYAAAAGIVPLTLKSGDGIENELILNQSTLNIEYDDLDEMVAEADRLLQNENYREGRSAQMKESIISEREFQESIGQILLKQSNEFDLNFNIEYNPEKLRQKYRDRFIKDKICFEEIASPRRLTLFWVMPRMFFRRCFYVFKNLMNKKH